MGEATAVMVTVAEPGQAVAPAALGDDRLVALWLWERPASTGRLNARLAGEFRANVGVPLAAVTVADLQAWGDRYADRAPATRATAVATIKSLLSYLHKAGLLSANVGAAIRPQAPRDALHERLLYASCVRVAELVGLR